MTYTYEERLRIWSKAAEIQGCDKNIWRCDEFGTVIKWSEYGKTSKYGWEVDHWRPQSRGGSDKRGNLRAMHWSNNRSKGSHVIRYRTRHL